MIIEKKEYYCIDALDLEMLILRTFPSCTSWDLGSYYTAGNQEAHYVFHGFALENSNFDKNNVEMVGWMIADNCPDDFRWYDVHLNFILTALVERGIIPEGQYLVKI